MNSQRLTGQRGFTLVELLVVITIIGILAAILVPTLNGVIRSTRESAIAAEIKKMEAALHDFKSTRGGYPPDLTDRTSIWVFLNMRFQRHKENALPANVARINTLVAQIDASEALVLWLRETKRNAEFPLTGAGQNYQPFDFDETRLIDFDGDGFFSYVPPSGPKTPYVYFESSTYASANALFDASPIPEGSGVARPYKADSLPANPGGGFQGEGTFQIICAGLDGHYGWANPADRTNKRYPSGTGYTPQDTDNITSYATGRNDNRMN